MFRISDIPTPWSHVCQGSFTNTDSRHKTGKAKSTSFLPHFPKQNKFSGNDGKKESSSLTLFSHYFPISPFSRYPVEHRQNKVHEVWGRPWKSQSAIDDGRDTGEPFDDFGLPWQESRIFYFFSKSIAPTDSS